MNRPLTLALAAALLLGACSTEQRVVSGDASVSAAAGSPATGAAVRGGPYRMGQYLTDPWEKSRARP